MRKIFLIYRNFGFMRTGEGSFERFIGKEMEELEREYLFKKAIK